MHPSYPILYYPHAALLKKTEPIEELNDGLKDIIQIMLERMYQAKGVGLAAPQIGLSIQLFVMDVSPERNQPRYFINPKIDTVSDQMCFFEEGCLSIPGIIEPILRPKALTVQAYDLSGTQYTEHFSELAARCFLHEYDHLQGRLIFDRMNPRTRRKALKDFEFLQSKGF